MKFNYEGRISLISEAIPVAERILGEDNFYALIAEKGAFEFSNCTAAEVAECVKNCQLGLTVKSYKHPFGPSLGKELPSDPTGIYINIAKNKIRSRSVASMVNTLVHESVHAADSDSIEQDFDHGDDNHSAGKGFSAPYWIGCLAEMMAERLGTVITVADVDLRSVEACG